VNLFVHLRTAFGLGIVFLASLYIHPQEHTFANPPMLYSQDGHLHVDLVAAPVAYTIEGTGFRACSTTGSTCPRSGTCGPEEESCRRIRFASPTAVISITAV